MRLLFAVIAATVLGTSLSQGPGDHELVGNWYPILHTGNRWIYEDEARDADNHHGIDDPTVGRWTTTETVVAVGRVREGTRVVLRTTISQLTTVNGWHDDPARLSASREWLIRGDCVYKYHSHSVDESVSFCFPMTAPGEWGRSPSTAPDEEGVWTIRTLNGDPFGLSGARTFHVYGHQGSGDTTDYWFQEGVGVVQFVEEHHGTYDEHRRQLISATIDGVTRAFALQPARTPPLDPSECRAGWRHWIRRDGSLIADLAECVAYARTREPGT